jgi:hypothetical protein
MGFNEEYDSTVSASVHARFVMEYSSFASTLRTLHSDPFMLAISTLPMLIYSFLPSPSTQLSVAMPTNPTQTDALWPR